MNEGAITKSIVYPVFRALYGVRLRQPAATEFGCSGRVVTYYLEQDFWGAEHAAAGIDLWLAAAAVCGDFRICEAVLGTRAGIARGTPADLGTTLAQIVGALFGDMEHRVEKWQRTRGSASIPILGGAVASMPPAPPLDIDGLIESFRLGYRELREIWTSVLPPRTIIELRKLTQDTTRPLPVRRSIVGEHRLRLCARLRLSRDASRPFAAISDAALYGLAGVVRPRNAPRDADASRRTG